MPNTETHNKHALPRITVITSMQHGRKSQSDRLIRFLDTLEPLSRDLHLIDGNSLIYKANFRNLNLKTRGQKPHVATEILRYIPNSEIGTMLRVAQTMHKTDVFIYYLSTPCILPTLLLKLLRKPTMFLVTGLGSTEVNCRIHSRVGRYSLTKIYRLMEDITFMLVNRVAVQSASMIHFHRLDRYAGKAEIFGARYVDSSVFNSETKFSERKNVIGYIGRLAAEKGVMNLAQAIPEVLALHENAEFLIIGGGALKKNMKGVLKDNNISERVTFVDWVSHDEIPRYLNQLKLLVSPSYSEGLPPIIQEAMACGTPVMATRVGAIPDIIENGRTGFIIQNNLPQTISKGIVSALEYSSLAEISMEARKFVAQKYTRETIMEQWGSAIERIFQGTMH